MSWLQGTLGEGFSSLKGQITKITKEVLAEGSEEEEKQSLEERLKELEAYCESQSLEISTLRNENSRLSKSSQSDGSFMSESHAKLSKFDLVDQSFELTDQTLQSVCKLENKIAELTQEKNSLSTELEELDNQHQNEMKQMLMVKQDLKNRIQQLEKQNSSLKLQFEDRGRNENSVDGEKLRQDLQNLSLDYELSIVDNKKKDAGMKTLQEEIESLKVKIKMEEKQREESYIKINNEIKEHENIKMKLEKLVLELKISNDERAKTDESYKNLVFRNEELKLEIQAVTNEVAELRHNNEQLHTELESIKAENRQIEVNMEEANGLTKESLEELKKEKEVVVNELERLKVEKLENEMKLVEEINYFKGLIDEKDKRIQDLVLQVENNQNNVSQTDDVKRLEQEVKKLTTVVHLKEQELKEALKQKTEHVAELNILKSVAVKTEQQLNNTMKEKESLSEEVAQWKNTIQNKDEKYMSLFNESQVLTDKCNSYEKLLSDASFKENELFENVSHLSETNKQLKTELETLAAQDNTENFRKQIDGISSINLNLQQQLNEARTLCFNQDQDLENLRSEIIIRDSAVNELRSRINELETSKLSSEQDDAWKNLSVELEMQKDELLDKNNVLEENLVSLNQEIDELRSANEKYVHMFDEYQNLFVKHEALTAEVEDLRQRNTTLQQDVEKLRSETACEALVKSQESGETAKKEFPKLLQHRRSKSDVMDSNNIVEDYKKEIMLLKEQVVALHGARSESAFLEEINGLNAALQQEQMKYKLLQKEYQTLKDKEVNMKRELDRLRLHLVEVEDHYTAEAVKREKSIDEIKQKLNSAEERLKNSSTVYTSQNIRANQHVESLQSQIKLMSVQRDDLQLKLSTAEDEAQKNQAALKNLQFVLEQFQQDKEREIHNVVTKYDCQLQIAKRQHQEYEDEIKLLNKQLGDAKDGLKAASRLGEQLEKKQMNIVKLEEVIGQLEFKLKEAENKISITTQTNISKVDKSLVKNLVISYASFQKPEHKMQVLKIMASVLDFNQEERNRTGVDNTATGWFNKILHPNTGMESDTSLSQAFIKFLENESRPQPQIKLLPETTPSTSQVKINKMSPILMSELVLPTFEPNDAQESSSILKDVLRNS